MYLKKYISKFIDKFLHLSFIRQVTIVTSGILILEFITMLSLHFLPSMSTLLLALIDCVTLLILLSPAIWLSIRKESRYQAARIKAREILMERDTRFYTLANSGQALIWTAGTDKKFDFVNQPFLTFTGRDYQQELGESWYNGVHPEDIKPFKELFYHSFEQCTPFSNEFRLLHSSGEYRWIQNEATPRYNRSGEFIGFIGHCLDITQRKQSECYREMTREVLHVINETDDLQELIKKTTAIIKNSEDYDHVIFRLKNDSGLPYDLQKDFTPPVLIGKKEDLQKIGSGIIQNGCLCRMVIYGNTDPQIPGFTSGGSWWSNDIREIRKIENCPDNGICMKEKFIRESNKSFALIPIRSKDKIFGLMQVTSDKSDRLSYMIIEKLEGIATYVGSALLHRINQEILTEKDKLLNRAQEIAHLGSWSLDLTTKQLTWSDEVYRIFGLEPRKFAASYEAFLERIHPDDREIVNRKYSDSVRENQKGYETEHRIIKKDSGEMRYVFEKCDHIRDDSGKIIRSIGMVQDITDTRNNEIALRENERLLRESQTAGNICSYSLNLTDRTWKASDELYTIYGIDKSTPNSFNLWVESLHFDGKEQIIDEILHPKNMDTGISLEYQIKRKNDGEMRWLLGLGKYETNEAGKPVRLIGTIQDITERKKAEEELKKLNEELEDRINERTAELRDSYTSLKTAEEKYRTLADYNYNWESWISEEGNYIYVSPSCFRITGHTSDEFINNPKLFYEIVHPEDRERVKQHFFDEHKKNLPEIALDFRIITFDGEERWISHNCHPVYDTAGHCLGQRASNSDITQRKEFERSLIDTQNQLRALTKHINDLTENERKRIAREIHDELGHLLTVIKYDMGNLISATDISLEKIKEELAVIMGMVESLIDSVRKIATELRPGILDHLGLFPAIEWQINQFQMLTKINCIYQGPEKEISFKRQDTTTIFRILQEILTNVARHSGAREVVISTEADEEYFAMKVKDNGTGFQYNEKIQSGSLGLMGMQERALSIGGEIKILSSPGNGTEISLLLNLK